MAAPVRSASLRAQVTIDASGSYPGGQATLIAMPMMAAPSIKELATLLPSPTYAILMPFQRRFFSRIVNRSDSTWQGWCKSVSPLMTGIVALRAHSSTVRCSWHRITSPSR